jgi:Terminase small subunit
MVTPAPALAKKLPAAKPGPAAATRPSLTSRQEAFCLAMAGNVGGAEAARRAGYSANGAKQRGAFLMRQPGIRVRIDEIHTARRAADQAELDEAAEQVGRVIECAFETDRLPLALRAIEFRLKLLGVIQDKRIAHHYTGCLDTRPHPDADLEDLAADPDEELDSVRFHPGFQAEPSPSETGAAPAAASDDPPAQGRIVTFDDLSQRIERMTSPSRSLRDTTALSGPVLPFLPGSAASLTVSALHGLFAGRPPA